MKVEMQEGARAWPHVLSEQLSQSRTAEVMKNSGRDINSGRFIKAESICHLEATRKLFGGSQALRLGNQRRIIVSADEIHIIRDRAVGCQPAQDKAAAATNIDDCQTPRRAVVA